MWQAAGLLSTNTLVAPQIALWRIYKALWLCSGFPLPSSISLVFSFLLSHILNQNLTDLVLLGHFLVLLRPSVYLLDWYQTCGVAVSWDFGHGSFQPYWSFFSECFQSDCALYHTKRGARIWICWGLRKAKNPITLRAWTFEDVPSPCPLPSPAASQPLSIPLAPVSGVFTGEHISTSLVLLVETVLACKAHLVRDACQQ